jgi:hypothetical protein
MALRELRVYGAKQMDVQLVLRRPIETTRTNQEL